MSRHDLHKLITTGNNCNGWDKRLYTTAAAALVEYSIYRYSGRYLIHYLYGMLVSRLLYGPKLVLLTFTGWGVYKEPPICIWIIK